MNLTEQQIAAIDRLDGALCNFLNGASDPYDPRLWIPETQRNFAELCEAYNECHVHKVMDLSRAVNRSKAKDYNYEADLARYATMQKDRP